MTVIDWGYILAAFPDLMQIKWLEANIPDISIVQLNTTADGVQALMQGRADGFVGDGGLI